MGGDGAPFGALWTCPDCGRAFARRNQTHTCRPLVALETHFAGRPARVREIFDRVVAIASRSGPVTVLPEQTRIALATRMSFCALMPRQAWLDGHVVLARRLEAPRFRRIETFGPRNHLHPSGCRRWRRSTPRSPRGWRRRTRWGCSGTWAGSCGHNDDAGIGEGVSALTYRERPAAGEPAGLLVLHHGRGSDERDLLGLADVLDRERRLHVVTPRAPLTLPGSPGYHWYVVPRVGYPDPATFPAAYAQLAALPRRALGAHRRRPRAHGPRRLLDGLGDELRARPRPRPPRPGRDPRVLRVRPRRRGLGARPGGPRRTRVFIAHGRNDPVMEVGFARRARDLLEGGGIPVDYHESDAGHHIDPEHVPAAIAWLGTTLAAAGADAR